MHFGDEATRDAYLRRLSPRRKVFGARSDGPVGGVGVEQWWVPSGTAAGRGRLGEASSPWEHLRSRRPWLPRQI